jgi:hypothetical protein
MLFPLCYPDMLPGILVPLVIVGLACVARTALTLSRMDEFMDAHKWSTKGKALLLTEFATNLCFSDGMLGTTLHCLMNDSKPVRRLHPRQTLATHRVLETVVRTVVIATLSLLGTSILVHTQANIVGCLLGSACFALAVCLIIMTVVSLRQKVEFDVSKDTADTNDTKSTTTSDNVLHTHAQNRPEKDGRDGGGDSDDDVPAPAVCMSRPLQLSSA